MQTITQEEKNALNFSVTNFSLSTATSLMKSIPFIALGSLLITKTKDKFQHTGQK